MSLKHHKIVKNGLIWAAVIAAITVLTGVSVYFLNFNSHSSSDTNVWNSIGYAFIYTTIFVVFNRGTLATMRRLVPLNTPRALILHILVQTVVSGLAFLIATAISALLISNDYEEWEDPQSIVVILVVSLLASLVLNTIWYGHTFYQRMMQAQQRASESRLTALKAQINPHFLFNTLNSIASLIRVNPHQAEEVTQNLSDLFRFTLNASKKRSVTLRAELESVKYYLEIEQVRFGERLEVCYEIDSRLLEIEVPSFVLQPLVENAVKHGVAQTDQKVVVTISAQCDKADGLLVLSVSDTGPGFQSTDKEELFQHGTALENIDEQLSYHYGKKAEMEIVANGVILRWPLDRKQLLRVTEAKSLESTVS